jgi:hypothetical protein
VNGPVKRIRWSLVTAARDAGFDVDRFEARRGKSGDAAFEVVGPAAEAATAANDFLVYLASRGRSFHTQRAYAIGLAHFLGWLAAGGRALEEAGRETVAAYILDFTRGAKGGAVRVDPRGAGRVNARTRKAAPAAERQPRTVNQRLTALRSFFAFLVERDERRGEGPWCGRENPVPLEPRGRHGMPGRDTAPRGRRAELRERVARTLPPTLYPGLAEELIGAACSRRDRAILTLLWRTG